MDNVVALPRGITVSALLDVQMSRGRVYFNSLYRERHMNWREHITVDPAVCHGQVCFGGTRIMVSVVLDNLAAGASAAELQASYPGLPADAIPAALAYAADLASERVIALPA